MSDIMGAARAKVARAAASQPRIARGAAPDAAPADPPPVRIGSRRISDVEMRDISWLWRGWLPAGMLSILDGDPAQGKSLITIDIAARLSRGLSMPYSDEVAAPANALLLAAEDAVEHTIAPRVTAAGADPTRVRVADTVRIGEHERPICMPDDFAALEREIVATDSRLLVIDPLLGFLAQSVDSHKDQSVRDVLHQLKLLAERTQCAVLGLRHLTKGSAGANPMYRGGGSIAITAAARSAFTVAAHPTESDAMVMASTKCNLTRAPRSLVYRVRDHYGLPVVDWLGECDLTAADLGATAPRGDGTAIDTAVEFLRDLLAPGRPMKADDVYAKADAAGISEKTLKRAKVKLGIVPRKLQFAGGWVWELPAAAEGGQAAGAPEGGQAER